MTSTDISFNERLLRAIVQRQSNLCVGLDPDPAMLSPEQTSVTAATRVAQLTAEFAVAFKPNAAFFEGSAAGTNSLRELSVSLGADAPFAVRICDAKRGDIGNTSRMYADAIFDIWNYDAVTVNPLMGSDSVEPFTCDPARGVFLLCLTSNPGASDFLLQHDLYLRIAEQAVKWNTRGNIGLVVGATQARHAARIREVAPELPFLIPGVGAQGGSLAEILDAIHATDNPRFLINASRSIMYPDIAEEKTYDEAVRFAACKLRDEISALTQRRKN